MRKQLLRADAVNKSESEMTEELLAAGITSTRIRRIPNGVDCRRFSPPSIDLRREARSKLGIPPDGLLPLFAGRLARTRVLVFLSMLARR